MNRTAALAQIVQDCIDNPVRSRHHDWAPGEQYGYNHLTHKGRSLYDNLRTKYDFSHRQALIFATIEFGTKNVAV